MVAGARLVKNTALQSAAPLNYRYDDYYHHANDEGRRPFTLSLTSPLTLHHRMKELRRVEGWPRYGMQNLKLEWARM